MWSSFAVVREQRIHQRIERMHNLVGVMVVLVAVEQNLFAVSPVFTILCMYTYYNPTKTVHSACISIRVHFIV